MNLMYAAVVVIAVVGVVFLLLRTRHSLGSTKSRWTVLSGDTLPESAWTDLEDALISADVGPSLARDIVQSVRAAGPANGNEARDALVSELVSVLGDGDRSLHVDGSPGVVVVVGVNGSGKTTTIAKLAHRLSSEGVSVVLGAADTFRAAADAQLSEWGARVGVPVVTGKRGSDPAAVAYESVVRARSDGRDVVIVDTAGRLHTQKNLMEELVKVVRVLTREAGKISEILLVLDGTTGQNGIVQAKVFAEAVAVTGIVITKLDGTSRGGIVIAVEHELGIPVKFVGSGENMDDLAPFVPRDFAESLLVP